MTWHTWHLGMIGAFIAGLLLIAPTPTAALVNINTASVEDLNSLPGVGDTVSQAIIAYREANGSFRDILELKNVKGIGDSLFNKIKDMITVAVAPSADVDTEPVQVQLQLTAAEVLAKFNHEPSVAEVQDAALKYAMIYADDVRVWKKGAKNQALLPQTKFRVDWDIKDNEGFDRSNNIKIDDESVIIGPDSLGWDEDKDNDWGFTLDFTWRLGEYVFNSNMLRVRGESEDIVQLRQDIVDDVTKLYYDRRRLQIDLELNPARSLSEQLKNELRLQELTANIDALTGGYLSSRLK